MNTQKSKATKVKKLLTVPLFVGLATLTVQKIHASAPSAVIAKENPQISLQKASPILPAGIHSRTSGLHPEKVTADTVKKKRKLDDISKNQSIERMYPQQTIQDQYDVAAEYPGGMVALRKKFVEVFDVSKLDGKGTIKTFVTFRLSQDGIADSFKAEGTDEAFNIEAEKAMIAANGNTVWKPAESSGKPVSSVFSFPVSMNFE